MRPCLFIQQGIYFQYAQCIYISMYFPLSCTALCNVTSEKVFYILFIAPVEAIVISGDNWTTVSSVTDAQTETYASMTENTPSQIRYANTLTRLYSYLRVNIENEIDASVAVANILVCYSSSIQRL